MLSFYASQFPMVEVNFTYYRMPSARVTQGMERKTPKEFEFVVKLNRVMTHSNPIIGSYVPDSGQAVGGPVDLFGHASSQAIGSAAWSLERAIAEFKKGIEPFVDAGKLKCVLAQFPWGFKNTRDNLRYVIDLAKEFDEFWFVVEFRNATWASDSVFDALRQNNIGFCCVDEPQLEGLFPPVITSTSSDVSYVRFHGRNAAKWWRHDRSSERYDYLYSIEELRPWADKIQMLAENSKQTYVLFNNCTDGKAAQNAKQMLSLLGLA
jgi:uncharacterized protein YecE (DUF72 family)